MEYGVADQAAPFSFGMFGKKRFSVDCKDGSERRSSPTMAKQDGQTFGKGFRDGLPILLGYLSVAFAFGMLGTERGLPFWGPTLVSLTNFTGTGQFVGITMLADNIPLLEITITIFIINIRYFLMSLSLSQKLEDHMPLWKRLVIAFGNTDEIFAVSMQQRGLLGFRYMIGLILSSYSGWVGGTFIGSVAGSVLPQAIISALGIAIFAMFIAIIIPPAKRSKPIAIVILVAVLMSCIFRYTPILNQLSSGWTVIICGVTASLIGAIRYPMEKGEQLQ